MQGSYRNPQEKGTSRERPGVKTTGYSPKNRLKKNTNPPPVVPFRSCFFFVLTFFFLDPFPAAGGLHLGPELDLRPAAVAAAHFQSFCLWPTWLQRLLEGYPGLNFWQCFGGFFTYRLDFCEETKLILMFFCFCKSRHPEELDFRFLHRSLFRSSSKKGQRVLWG